MINSTDDEIETFRIDRLATNAQEREMSVAQLTAHFAPGSFGYHEALHTTSVLMDSVDRHIAEHPAVLADRELYRLATRAQEALFNLYQLMGAKGLR
jgi:hypothetical protein